MKYTNPVLVRVLLHAFLLTALCFTFALYGDSKGKQARLLSQDLLPCRDSRSKDVAITLRLHNMSGPNNGHLIISCIIVWWMEIFRFSGYVTCQPQVVRYFVFFEFVSPYGTVVVKI